MLSTEMPAMPELYMHRMVELGVINLEKQLVLLS
jgi:hypothetical protein